MKEELNQIDIKDYPYLPLMFSTDMGLNLIQYDIIELVSSYKINDDDVEYLKGIILECEKAIGAGLTTPPGVRFSSKDWLNTAKFINQFDDPLIASVITFTVVGQWNNLIMNVSKIINELKNKENEKSNLEV